MSTPSQAIGVSEHGEEEDVHSSDSDSTKKMVLRSKRAGSARKKWTEFDDDVDDEYEDDDESESYRSTSRRKTAKATAARNGYPKRGGKLGGSPGLTAYNTRGKRPGKRGYEGYDDDFEDMEPPSKKANGLRADDTEEHAAVALLGFADTILSSEEAKPARQVKAGPVSPAPNNKGRKAATQATAPHAAPAASAQHVAAQQAQQSYVAAQQHAQALAAQQAAQRAHEAAAQLNLERSLQLLRDPNFPAMAMHGQRRCARHVGIAYFVFFSQRKEELARRMAQVPGLPDTSPAVQSMLSSFSMDPTQEARALKEKSESQRHQQQAQQLPPQFLQAHQQAMQQHQAALLAQHQMAYAANPAAAGKPGGVPGVPQYGAIPGLVMDHATANAIKSDPALLQNPQYAHLLNIYHQQLYMLQQNPAMLAQLQQMGAIPAAAPGQQGAAPAGAPAGAVPANMNPALMQQYMMRAPVMMGGVPPGYPMPMDPNVYAQLQHQQAQQAQGKMGMVGPGPGTMPHTAQMPPAPLASTQLDKKLPGAMFTKEMGAPSEPLHVPPIKDDHVTPPATTSLPTLASMTEAVIDKTASTSQPLPSSPALSASGSSSLPPTPSLMATTLPPLQLPNTLGGGDGGETNTLPSLSSLTSLVNTPAQPQNQLPSIASLSPPATTPTLSPPMLETTKPSAEASVSSPSSGQSSSPASTPGGTAPVASPVQPQSPAAASQPQPSPTADGANSTSPMVDTRV